MNALARSVDMTPEQWLEHRKTHIGASDVPVILGLVPYKSPFTLYCQKRGLVPSDDETIAMRAGHALEPLIAELYQEATGRDVWNPGDFRVFIHPDNDWLTCTLDRAAKFDAGKAGPVELKSAAEFKAKDWKDEEAPLPHVCQNQIQQAVVGAEIGSVAGLVGNREFAWFDQERNDRLLKAIIPKLKEFYERLQTCDPPPVDGTDSTAETLKVLHPKDDGTTAYNAELEAEALQYLELQESIKSMEADQKALKNRLIAAIGNATFGVFGCVKFSHKHQTRGSYVAEATEFRVLRKCK